MVLCSSEKIQQLAKMSTTNNPLVFVYYKVRGKMQPIRNLVLYLSLPFIEVHIENEEQRKTLPEFVLQSLKGQRIDKCSLPLLVYQGLYIYDIYPIMAYICRRFKREDLLGSNIHQRTRLQEILQIFFVKQPNSMTDLFTLSEFCAEKTDAEIMAQKRNSIKKFYADSGYLKQICIYLERQERKDAFVLGGLTILDLLFLESCHYMLGMFNNIDEKLRCPITNILCDFFNCKSSEDTPEEIKHLVTMRNYVSFMYTLPFYVNNKEYLQSFSIICQSFKPQRVKGIRKMWAYNKSLVQ